MKKDGMTYRIELVEPASEVAFDIENWLADLLVDYWLNKGDGGNDSCPLLPEIIGRKATLTNIYKKRDMV